MIRGLVVINDVFLASCSHDMTIKLWSLSTYSQVKSWKASTSHILSLAFDSTLNMLASSDSNTNNNVYMWDSAIWTTTLVPGI